MVLVAVAVGALYQFAPGADDWFFNPERLWRLIPWQFVEHQWLLAAAAVLLLFLLLRVFSAVWYVLRFHGYVLESSGSEFRIRCGLFSRLSATIPQRRIQLISIHRTVLGKTLGIASLRIETAGGSGGTTEGAGDTISRRWFVPVIPEERIPDILSHIRPGLVWDEKGLPWSPPSRRAAARMRRIAVVIGLLLTVLAIWQLAWWGVAIGLIVCGTAYWYAGKKAAAMRYVRTDGGMAYRSGLLTKKCSITFLDKVQSVWIDHSPFDRRWRMAKLCLDTAGSGPAEHKIHVPMLEEDFARRERDEIARRASQRKATFG
jgi:putative membrane protein